VASLRSVLTNVQVLPGTTSVARFDDVLVWFETDPRGGGTVLNDLLEAVRSVAGGSVASRQLGARLATILNGGDTTAVPALVAATPEGNGLRVVVHGWGAVVADGIHIPNGWFDQVVTERSTFFLGRNTATPLAPVEGSVLDLEEGVVPGDGVSFALAHAGAPITEPPPASPPADSPTAVPAAAGSPGAPSAAPVAAAPPAPAGAPLPAEPPAYEPPPSDPPLEPAPPGASAAEAQPAPAPLPPGRIVLDDGRSAVLERTCVLGSAPHGSPAVQTGVAVPLTVTGTGVAAVHVELRLEQGTVAVRDLGSAATYVLRPDDTTWKPLAPGQLSTLEPGSRIAIGQRTLSYERP
jgi:hypothetical protein